MKQLLSLVETGFVHTGQLGNSREFAKWRLVLALVFVLAVFCNMQAQPNCNVFLWKGDTAQYQACTLLTENQDKYYQFSKAFHQLVDSAILICPRFAYAYREKAAPYVKSGNFLEWKKYIDLAVKYDSLAYLPVRASLRYKFFADYAGAIQDIEWMEKISRSDIGFSSNGAYHLTIVKALCYKQLGKPKEGIKTIENRLNNGKYTAGLYDYLHLGVMHYQVGDYEKAIDALNQQRSQHDFAEVSYYLALCHQRLGNTEAYAQAKQAAVALFNAGQKLFDDYHYMIDQIFEQDLAKL